MVRILKRFAAFISAAMLITPACQTYAAQSFELIAEAAILVEQTTGKTLYGKNENKRMYPASMTKIITALVAMDYLKPLKRKPLSQFTATATSA